MGAEVDVFLGPLEALQRWKEQLPSVVVFALTPELGLVPETEELHQELASHQRRQSDKGYSPFRAPSGRRQNILTPPLDV